MARRRRVKMLTIPLPIGLDELAPLVSALGERYEGAELHIGDHGGMDLWAYRPQFPKTEPNGTP